jgi:hypothetical protein
MALNTAVGQAHALNGREAALQATHQALNRLGPVSPGFGIVIASHQYQARDIVSGVSGLLGDTPLIGFSSPVGLTADGVHPNSVVVALFAGDVQAETHWLPGYAQSARETGAKILKIASERKDIRALLFFADGFNGDADQLCNTVIPTRWLVRRRGLARSPRRFCAATSAWASARRTAGTRSEVSSA